MALGTFSSANYLTRTASLPSYPFTVAAWVYFTNKTTAQTIWGAYDPSTTTNSLEIRINASGFFSAINRNSGGNVTATSIVAVTNNAWNFVAASFASATADKLFFGGATYTGTNGASTFNSGLCSREGVGIRADSSLPTFPLLNGGIGELAIYSGDLITDFTNTAITGKVTPLDWRGASLLNYWPFYTHTRNFLTGVADWTTTGTLTQFASGPPVSMPSWLSGGAEGDGYIPSDSTGPWGIPALGRPSWESGGLGVPAWASAGAS